MSSADPRAELAALAGRAQTAGASEALPPEVALDYYRLQADIWATLLTNPAPPPPLEAVAGRLSEQSERPGGGRPDQARRPTT